MRGKKRDHAWKEEQLEHRISIVPVTENLEGLRIIFPTPDVLAQYIVAVSLRIHPHVQFCELVSKNGVYPYDLASKIRHSSFETQRTRHFMVCSS